MQDIIQREIAINAPKEKVYQAISDPTQITKWFPDSIVGEVAVGARPLFIFDGHGKSQTYIEAMQPYSYFAFRWIPGGSDFVGDVLTVPNTLVEFRIEESNGVSTVTMTESGFAKLPADLAASSLAQNSGGWDYMLGRLEKYFVAE